MNVDYLDQPQQPRWSRGLCHGGEDVTACYITCFLPCITFGQIAETVDEGRSSCVNQSTVYGLLFTIQCHWFYSWLYRDKLRQKFGLPEEPCSDCCVHIWCYACALCQEHAELKHRGFNASKVGLGHQPLLDRCLLPCSNDLQRLAEDGSIVCVAWIFTNCVCS